MKKLSEVCKIVGVTRRALQGYDEIGLLHPTAKTPGGYWLYDEAAISKLVFIQLFVELGYKRKDIMPLLDESAYDIDKELDNAADLLLEKRKHIDGLLKMIKIVHITAKLSKNTIHKMKPVSFGESLNQESFAEIMQKNIVHLSDEDKDERKEYMFLMQVMQHLIILCQLKNNPVDDPDVKTIVNSLSELLIEVVIDILREEGMTEIRNKTIDQLVTELWDSIISEPTLADQFDNVYGNGSIAYIDKAVRYYIARD